MPRGTRSRTARAWQAVRSAVTVTSSRLPGALVTATPGGSAVPFPSPSRRQHDIRLAPELPPGRDKVAIILRRPPPNAECRRSTSASAYHRCDATFKAAPPDRPAPRAMGHSAAAAAAPVASPGCASSSLQPALDRRRKSGLGARRRSRREAAAAARRASAALPWPGVKAASAGARSVSKLTSTSGTRISSECAMPAQSASRRSWLRR